MLLGARQDCIGGGTTIAEKMTVLHQFGFDFLELALTRSEIMVLDSASAEYYREMVQRIGLPILSTSLGHFGGFAAMDQAEQDQVVEHIDALIDWTHTIGADTILLATTEAGTDVTTYAPAYQQKIVPLADRAAALGITLALEHVGWYKPAALAELVRRVDHPAIRIYFDMGNCLYVGESPLEQARICAPYTAQLHIKGGPTTPLGAMPLAAVRETLERSGFGGRGCLEIPSGEGDRPLAEARGLLRMAGYAP
jgi:sugar phosphate isomerase/epimerase